MNSHSRHYRGFLIIQMPNAKCQLICLSSICNAYAGIDLSYLRSYLHPLWGLCSSWLKIGGHLQLGKSLCSSLVAKRRGGVDCDLPSSGVPSGFHHRQQRENKYNKHAIQVFVCHYTFFSSRRLSYDRMCWR